MTASQYTGRRLWISLVILLSASAVVEATSLEDAFALQKKGRLKEARDLFRVAAAEFRTSGDQRSAARALSSAGKISVSLGDYPGAIAEAEQAVKLRRTLKESSELGADFNTLGRANQYLGNYPAALENYQNALKVDRTERDAAGEVTLLNNIGNIYYFQGRYSSALESYQQALARVNATRAEPLNPYERQLTSANIATLYQRLGLEERALELYKQLSGKEEAMPPNEYAQMLLNEGVLYRRLGDPIKAFELYRTAQDVFRSDHHADGEIGALRNIGIAKAVDLGDLFGALDAFSGALKLSKQSSNSRGVVQSSLYLGEVFRRLNRMNEAKANLEVALDVAQKAGLVEDQWKSLHALGRVAEQTGAADTALDDYRRAIAIIESIRAGLQVTSLRSDFLADKRDVYDSLIALHLQKPVPDVSEIFQWMERSRARTLLDRMSAQTPLRELSLKEIQSRVPQDTTLVEFWIGNQSSVAVWITSAGSGVVRYPSADELRESTALLVNAVQAPGNQWQELSRKLGNRLLTGIPLRPHMIVVPDGPLNIPFEVLGIPGSVTLLIEKCDVSFLPSAQFGAMPKVSQRWWALPWRRQLVAFGDPPVSSSDELAETEHWQTLPASTTEIRGIARVLPGKTEIHLGPDARKIYLLEHRNQGVPLLHFSTHAMLDVENPDRSRILLAGDSPNAADYVFQEEVYNLDLKNVDLVTVSACDTARGKMVRGEGIQAFSQAFLAAGASATVTSLWRVADEPTASFMEEFYYFLGRGASKAEALQAAKLRFLRSNSALSSPRYWAAFVLNGDGWNPSRRVVPWSALLFALAAILIAAGLVLWRLRASRLRG